MEFVLLGKRKINKAMKKGSARHAKLEEEVKAFEILSLHQSKLFLEFVAACCTYPMHITVCSTCVSVQNMPDMVDGLIVHSFASRSWIFHFNLLHF